MNIIEELEKLIESHYNEEIDSRDEWLREVVSLKERLVNKTNDIHDVSHQRELLKAFQEHYEKTLRDDFIYDEDIESFLNDFNCG